MCASSLGETTEVTQTEYIFRIFFRIFFPISFFFFFLFSVFDFFVFNFFGLQFFLAFNFFLLLVLFCWQLWGAKIATVVPGRQALAGRAKVEDAGGTAGIVRCAVACARRAAKP